MGKRGSWAGSVVSEGTLSQYDLVHAFASVLEEIANSVFNKLVQDGSLPREAHRDPNHSFWRSENASWLVDDLFDALNEAAPEGHYFGSHESDGACFGFYPIIDEGQ